MNRPKLTLSTSLVQDNVPCAIKFCDNVSYIIKTILFCIMICSFVKLYIGSIHAAFNIDKLKELGVTHVLNASGLPVSYFFCLWNPNLVLIALHHQPTYPKVFTYLSIDHLRDKVIHVIAQTYIIEAKWSPLSGSGIITYSWLHTGGQYFHRIRIRDWGCTCSLCRRSFAKRSLCHVILDVDSEHEFWWGTLSLRLSSASREP